jgi:hypothetical protein
LNRAFTFSDPTIVRRLKEEFIPFAGNTAELQPGLAFEEVQAAKWFMKMADQKDWRKQGNTTQGMYIASANGKTYAFKNTPGKSDTLRFMDKGLEEFKKNLPPKVEITTEELEARYTHKPKPETSVLAVYSRVCPIPEGADNRNRNIGKDYFWIAQSEVEEILDAEAAAPAEPLKLPQSIIARMCRFTFLDLIRGEPDFWTPRQVEKAAFSLEKKGVDGALHSFAFNGGFRNETGFLSRRGIEGTVSGEFTINAETKRIVKFRAYAASIAWGASTLTQRGLPNGKFPLIFALIEADDDPYAREVSPSAVSRNEKDYREPAFPEFK